MFKLFSTEPIVHSISNWNPKTNLGKMVLAGNFSTFTEVLDYGLPISEEEIYHYFFPKLERRSYFVGYVNKTTPGGRRRRARVFTVLSDGGKFIGFGSGKGATIFLAAKKSQVEAMKNLSVIDLGCGSFQCNCGTPHSLTTKKRAKVGSSVIELHPMPVSTGIVGLSMCKGFLEMTGVRDLRIVVVRRSSVKYNQAHAFVNALSTFKLP